MERIKGCHAKDSVFIVCIVWTIFPLPGTEVTRKAILTQHKDSGMNLTSWKNGSGSKLLMSFLPHRVELSHWSVHKEYVNSWSPPYSWMKGRLAWQLTGSGISVVHSKPFLSLPNQCCFQVSSCLLLKSLLPPLPNIFGKCSLYALFYMPPSYSMFQNPSEFLPTLSMSYLVFDLCLWPFLTLANVS